MAHKNFVLALAWFGRPRISLVEALFFPTGGVLVSSGWYITAILTLLLGMSLSLACSAARYSVEAEEIAKEGRVTKV